MVIEVRPVHSANASSPMLVTLFGMKEFLQPSFIVLVAVSMIALQLSRESYTEFPLSTMMVLKLEQPAKENDPMLVTLFGMVIETSEEQ